MKRIVVLGSTGSIGTQTLDVVRRHADKLEVWPRRGTRTGELLRKRASSACATSRWATSAWLSSRLPTSCETPS
mgnify:CR=1 FL=1